MRVEIKFFDDEGKQFRALNVEGSRSDIGCAFASLFGEWRRHIILGERKTEKQVMDDTTAALFQFFREQFGYDKAMELELKLRADEEPAAQAFQESGRPIAEIPEFITARIRQIILSVTPEIPETLLDQVISKATEGLRAELQDELGIL